MQIRMQLTNLHKNEMSMVDYFQKTKVLTDTLASIGKPLRDEEIICYILAGLGLDYDTLVASVTTRADAMIVSDLYPHLLSFELRVEHENSLLQTGSSANNVTLSNNNPSHNNRDGRRFRRGRGRNSGRGLEGSGNKPTCQVCGKVGHNALWCYHRFGHSYQAEES